MDNVKSLAYSDNHGLYSFSPYPEPFNDNLSLYSQLFNINSLSHKLLPSELFSKPSDQLAEPLFELLSELPSEPQPPFKQPSELILSEPLPEILSEPLFEIPSEPLPVIPSKPLPEAPSEPLPEPLPEPHFETYFELDENIDSLGHYQYNLAIGDTFDNWESVNAFMYQYCLERGFGYQIFRSDKDQNDPTIIRRKSFRCSSSGNYEARKIIDQKSHRLRGTIKTNCEWHCNFTFPKTAHYVKCTTLTGVHNHEISPAQISHVIARYRRFSDEMIQDLQFFIDCKVAPITALEMLKKKYPQHVFHKQDVYNAFYKLCQNNHEKSDSISLLDTLFEKVSQDPTWKVFVRHSGNEHRLSGVFWMSPSQQELYRRFSDIVLNDNTCKTNKFNMYLSVFMVKDNNGRFRNVANALVEDELSSTYVWILKCLMQATNSIIPKSIWTDFEPGLINAISQVFPNTQHFLCLFHIWQNIVKHLKTPLGSNFDNFSKAFYSCRNSLSTEIFEQRWEFMIKTSPECQRYMTRTLYPARMNWAKAYTPFQFNAGIQSTQSVESFNGIIKRSLNAASTLCDVQEAIDKRHKEEIEYCQLVDLKARHTTIGLPHISSQFFSSVDMIIVKFLTPLTLSLQQFQISQSFTYEGQIAPEVYIYYLIKYNSVMLQKTLLIYFYYIGSQSTI